MKQYLGLGLLAALAPGAGEAAALRVSEDGRSFVSADGQPFFWLGDTAWELIHRLDRTEATYYLERRAEQAFTVIQAVILAESDGLRVPNAHGELPFIDLDPRRPNEAYFEHVDFIAAEAARLGLRLALLPTWGDKVPSDRTGHGPVIFNRENARDYGRFLGRRYREAPVVWMLGGDRSVVSDEAFEIWRAMGLGLREGGGGAQLMTFHPAGEETSARFHAEPWLNFHTYQSGHRMRFHPVWRFAEELASLRPRKPFLDSEPSYEDLPVRFWDFIDWNAPEPVPPSVLDARQLLARPEFFKLGLFDDYDVRVHAYWNLMAGAAGHSYGHNAVWQMHRPGRRAAIPCLQGWREALDRPGAQQMRHLRTLFERRSWARLRPDPSLVYPEKNDAAVPVRSALADDRTFALVYLATGRAVEVVLGKVNGPRVRLTWYDPSNGGTTPGGEVANEARAVFTPPAVGERQDWVLVLDSLEATLPDLAAATREERLPAPAPL